MIGLKRQKKTEGWEEPVTGTDADWASMPLVQRLAENSKVWILCVALIVVVVACMITRVETETTEAGLLARSAKSVGTGPYRDAAHNNLTKEILSDKSSGAVIADARFLGPNRFRITVPGDVSADEIDYVAKMAALKILRRFKHRAVVLVYTRSAADGSETHIASAKWDPDKQGYVVNFKSSNDIP